MTRYRPPLVLASTVVLLFAASPTGRAAAPGPMLRITAAANVTLRTSPSANATAVAQLPLGTELADAGPPGLDKTWIRVKLGDAREGWLLTSLTRPLDPAWRWPTFDRIIADRLGRKGDGFQASAELVGFIDRVAPQYTDADGRARLELSRLKALASTLSAIPAGGTTREPYAGWLAAHKAELVFDEPGGRWMIAESSIWDRHARLSSTTSGDEIAWFAVTNGLAGECEGHLVCYLNARNRLHGEYLRRHPAGTHITEAADEIKATTDLLAAPVSSKAAYDFDAKRDCRDVSAALDALSGAVKNARITTKDPVLASIGGLRKLCQ